MILELVLNSIANENIFKKKKKERKNYKFKIYLDYEYLGTKKKINVLDLTFHQRNIILF